MKSSTIRKSVVRDIDRDIIITITLFFLTMVLREFKNLSFSPEQKNVKEFEESQLEQNNISKLTLSVNILKEAFYINKIKPELNKQLQHYNTFLTF